VYGDGSKISSRVHCGRSRLALTLSEREVISRGIAAHQSARSIAKLLDRSPSTVSREISRNGGYDRYRAALADENAWARSRRPKCCKLANSPRLRQAVVRTKLGRNKTDGIDASRIREYCELFKPSPWAPPSEAHRRLGELQTIRAGIIAGLTEWKNRKNSGIVDTEAQALADATILHFTSQLGAVDKAIALTIDNDSDLRSKRDLLLSINGVGDTLAGVVLAELPGPDVLRSSGEVVAYAGLNPRQHQSGTSVDRATRISKIGNAVLRAALYMPALSAMRYNPAIVALVTRLKSWGRLKPKQIVVAAMRKLLVLCFGVLKTGKPFDPAIAMGC
jgi:transposase